MRIIIVIAALLGLTASSFAQKRSPQPPKPVGSGAAAINAKNYQQWRACVKANKTHAGAMACMGKGGL
ncbi:MAG: hypothetical protein C5B60_07880 [Chloroflexi bacterium]|nr:MAG: hypothetical protein C5B60_07880 [Chloroflexota bacterium]